MVFDEQQEDRDDPPTLSLLPPPESTEIQRNQSEATSQLSVGKNGELGGFGC